MTKKEIKREVIDMVYISNDGKEFKSEEDCKQYEKSWKCTIKASFKNIPHVVTTEYDLLGKYAGYDDYDVYLMKPRNLNDIRVINLFFKLSEKEAFTQDDIDKECVVGRYNYEEKGYKWEYGIETIMKIVTQEVMKIVAQEVDKLRNELQNFGNKTDGEAK